MVGLSKSIAFIDLDELERALALQSVYLTRARELAQLPNLRWLETSLLARAKQIISLIPNREIQFLTPSDLYELADRTIARNRTYLDLLHKMHPAMAILGLAGSDPGHILEAVALAAIAAAEIPVECRPWVRAASIDASAFQPLHVQWIALRREENELRALLPQFREDQWPSANSLEAVAKTLRKTGIGSLISQMTGATKTAQEILGKLHLSLPPAAAADLIRRIANHTRALAQFKSSSHALTVFGKAWTGMSTPFKDIDTGIMIRRFIEQKLGEMRDGPKVAVALFSLAPEGLAALSLHSSIASEYRAALEGLREGVDGTSLDTTKTRLRNEITSFEAALRADPTRDLSAADVSISQVAKIVDARTRVVRAKAAVDSCPLAVAVRSLALDNTGLENTARSIAWIRTVRGAELPPPIRDGLLSESASEWRARLREAASSYGAARAIYQRAKQALGSFQLGELNRLDLVPIITHLDRLLDHRDELTEFVNLQLGRRDLENVGLSDFLKRIDSAQIPPSRLVDLFEVTVARQRANSARRLSLPLAQRTGNELEANRKTFVQRDKQKIISDRAAVRVRLLKKQPPVGSRNGPVKAWTQMSLLANEFPKQRRFTPVRALLGRAAQAVQALKPCFMMSPLSLAKFLPAGALEFDVLVIDEASQMRPEDALGAMLRSKQIVVVGDPKQLPPTSFFDRSADNAALDGEDIDAIDDKSILERCQKVLREVRRLKWHYRSRCESLIRFSNDNFYEGSLITFPAAKPGSFSIDLLRVDGLYQGRRNVVEAERIAEEAVKFMREFALTDEEHIPTLGIVAINIEQRDLIQEILRRISHEDDRVELYQDKAQRKGEPLFVKNLENVQGDERDFIFISMTYGKEAGASVMKQHFGPINSSQGHRRLNVLFSRARIRVWLFTSFGSGDIRPGDTSREGVYVLKRYFEYAEVKGRAPVERIGIESDSDFEIEVADRLRSRGFEVDLQIGVSGFKIDLGVRHPDHPEMFLAGVECDGATYHSSKSARDRDRLREQVLRDLGWEILRVWSTDWFDNPDAQTERLVKRLEEVRKKSISGNRDYEPKASYGPTTIVETGSGLHRWSALERWTSAVRPISDGGPERRDSLQ